MVRVETFYPIKIRKAITIYSKVVEDVKVKRMRCYGSNVEECSAVRMKRGFEL